MGGIPTADLFALGQSQSKSALQRWLAAAEFILQAGIICDLESAVGCGRLGNFHCFLPGVVAGVVGEQRHQPARVLLQLVHRTGEPLVDRAVHQGIGEHEHGQRRGKREQQRADHHARLKTRPQHAQPSLGIQLKQVAEQDEGKGYQQQKDQRGERHQEQSLLRGTGTQVQIKGLLRENQTQEQNNHQGQRHQHRAPLARGKRTLVFVWLRCRHKNPLCAPYVQVN